MNYLYLAGAAFISLVVGLVLGAILSDKTIQPEIKELLKTRAIDRANYLFTLRREIANILIWQDPQRFVKLYQELCSEINSYKSWRIEEINKHLSELSKKYHEYRDFDCIELKEYVLYAENKKNYEKLELCYRDIATFIGLSLISNTSWKDAKHLIPFDLANEFIPDKLEFLMRYAKEIENTKFVMRIQVAMRDYYNLRNQGLSLNNEYFTVQINQVRNYERRYSIHIKRTNEFAIYSEDNEYYRSDLTFEKEDHFSYDKQLLEVIRKSFFEEV